MSFEFPAILLLFLETQVNFKMQYLLKPGGKGGGKMSPKKSVVQSACQYDVTSHVSDFQNGEQSVHRRDDFLDLEILRFLLS